MDMKVWDVLMSQKAGVWGKVQLAARFWWKHSKVWESHTSIYGFAKERNIREHAMLASLNQSCKFRATRTEKNYLAHTINFTHRAVHRGSGITVSPDQNAYAAASLAASVTTHHQSHKWGNLWLISRAVTSLIAVTLLPSPGKVHMES